jgi:hypothetical protein
LITGIVRSGLCVVLLALASCASPDSPQAKLDAFLAQAVAAAEDRDTSEIMDLVAEDYQDAQGRGQDDIRRYLMGMFLRYGSVHVDLETVDIPQLTDLGGEVELSLGLAGQRGDNNPLWSLGARRTLLRLELIAEGKDAPFQVLRASWRPGEDRD